MEIDGYSVPAEADEWPSFGQSYMWTDTLPQESLTYRQN